MNDPVKERIRVAALHLAAHAQEMLEALGTGEGEGAETARAHVTDQREFYNGIVDAIERQISDDQKHRPERVIVPLSEPEPSWTINDIQVGHVVVRPTPAERAAFDERRRQNAADHMPRISRTLIGGPGNRSRVDGCSCDHPGIGNLDQWAAHMLHESQHQPDRNIATRQLVELMGEQLALRDAAFDAADYPSPETLVRLRRVLKRPARP